MLIDSSSASGPRHIISSVTRAGEWWEYKLAPTFATFYATALFLKMPLHSLWPLLLIVLLALVPGAAYVSIINDVTDFREDLASGKANRLVGKSRFFVGSALVCSILPGLAFVFLWRHDLLLVGLYGAAWLAFSLYSLPPFRLKNRGLWGVLADASGSNLFPHLVVVVLIFRWHHVPVNPLWFAGVALWSFCYGLRGILWHQLSDLQNDEKANIATFARLHSSASLKRLGEWGIFPLEIVGLLLILGCLHHVLVFGFLFFYLVLEALRAKLWHVNLVIVTPKERFHILMQEYYDVFYPVALLLAAVFLHPWDLLVLLLHLLLFPARLSTTLKDVPLTLKGALQKIQRRTQTRA